MNYKSASEFKLPEIVSLYQVKVFFNLTMQAISQVIRKITFSNPFKG